MPPLAAIERFFERLFERPSARLFHTRLQPIQVQRRIERAMEAERRVTPDGTHVPDRFVIHLHPDDLTGFGELTETMAFELADRALSFARARHYALAVRPQVDLLADERVERADIRVEAHFSDPPGRRPAGAPATAPAPDAEVPPTDPTPTLVFAVPQPRAPRAIIEVVDPDGRFDTVNVESLRSISWVMPDDPMRSLGPEMFLRDYFEPRLLPRLLAKEPFKPVRPLVELNRALARGEGQAGLPRQLLHVERVPLGLPCYPR